GVPGHTQPYAGDVPDAGRHCGLADGAGGRGRRSTEEEAVKARKRVVAEVETCTAEKDVRFDVTSARTVTLVFPDAQYSSFGRSDFRKSLRPDEARAVGEALIEAADEVEASA